jgi:hypothetical protein
VFILSWVWAFVNQLYLGFPATFPSRNPPIIIIFSYPNIALRNSGSHLSIGVDKGEFPRFSNPTRNFFPSLEGYGSFLTLTSM